MKVKYAGLILLFCLSSRVYSQNYELGFQNGREKSLMLRWIPVQTLRTDIRLSWPFHHRMMGFLLESFHPVPSCKSESLRYYLGWGAAFGYEQINSHESNGLLFIPGIKASISPQMVLGLEYRISSLPLIIGFEWTPSIKVLPRLNFFKDLFRGGWFVAFELK